MKIGYSLIAAALAVATVPGTAAALDMKIGFVTINDSQHRAAEAFVSAIDERTKGEIKGRVFPAAQLGTIPRQIEGLQFGTQEAFLSPPGFFVGLNKAFQAADAPALFSSMQHQADTLNHPTVRDDFLNLATDKGVKGIMVWAAGASAFATRVPVRTVADLKGLKIRVLASPMERTMMEAIGVAGIPMNYSEVLPAIQRREIDGARAVLVVMGPSKFYTAAKYITIEGGSYIPSAFWVSARWFEKLSADQQAAIMAAGRDITTVAQRASEEIATLWETKWAEEGGEVLRFEPDEQKRLMDIYRPLGDSILGSDPAIAPMYEKIKAAAKATM
ncbi:MAG: TRAP transporter substrate-binding protein [Rhodospirillaceae bacterium]